MLDNLCNTHCSELADVSALSGRESVVIGGIVTAIKSKFTKTGKPCGFVTIEDFAGSGELAMFGEEWGRWSGMFKEGCAVYITAKCQQRYRDSKFFDLRIQNIEYLQTIKDKAIDRITISLSADLLDEKVVEELNEIICDNPGQTKLFFRLHDSRGKNHVLLRSQNRTVDVKRNLIAYIEQTPALDYKIN